MITGVGRRAKLLRVLGAAVCAAGLAVTCPAAARAQTAAPVCDVNSELLSIVTPEAVARGRTYTIELDAPASAISAVSLQTEFTARDADKGPFAPVVETIAVDASGLTAVSRAAPELRGRLLVTIAWVQQEVGGVACTGTESAEIDVQSSGFRAGDPSVPRLAGKYRARWSDGDSSTWRFTPRCNLYGCSADVKSSAGLKGTFRHEDGDTFIYTERGRLGKCQVEYISGRRADWTIKYERTITLRVVKDGSSRAVRIRGKERFETWVPSDPIGLCDGDHTTYRRITLTAKR